MPPSTSDGRLLHRTTVVVTTAALVTILLLLAWRVRDVLMVAFAGVLLAILLRGIAVWVHGWTKLPRRVAVVLTLLVFLGVIALAVWWRGPIVAAQAQELRAQLPQAVQTLRDWLTRFGVGQQVAQQIPAPQELIPDIRTTVERATGIASRAFSIVANFFIVLFVGIVLALQPRPYVNGLVRLVPPRRRDRAREILSNIEHVLRRWLAAQLISMTIVGTLTGIGLWLLDIPLAFTLAVIAGALEFVPYLGPWLSGVPAVLLALVLDPQTALWVALLYLGIQLAESYVIAPFVQWKAIWLPPALLIIAQLVLGATVGLWGVALAAPLAAVIMTLVQDVYLREVLHDRADDGSEAPASEELHRQPT